MAFVGTELRLVTASVDTTARVWDAVTGACLLELKGHTGRVNRVRVSASGARCVTCSDDNTARVWGLEGGECIRWVRGFPVCLPSAPAPHMHL